MTIEPEETFEVVNAIPAPWAKKAAEQVARALLAGKIVRVHHTFYSEIAARLSEAMNHERVHVTEVDFHYYLQMENKE